MFFYRDAADDLRGKFPIKRVSSLARPLRNPPPVGQLPASGAHDPGASGPGPFRGQNPHLL